MTSTTRYSSILNTEIMEYDHKWLDRLNTIIEIELSSPDLNNKLISELMGISERQLFRRLNEITELTPRQYIRQFRLEQAKIFLEEGTYLTVNEVAHAVGFINVGYFIRNFTERYENTPLEILKQNGWR